jgi:5-methylcytosine-specific restriction endonuclease McrA
LTTPYVITRPSSSSTGHIKCRVFEIVYHEVTNPKSRAAYVMMKEDYRQRDADFIAKHAEILERIQFSRDYLTKKKEELGSLSCSYCPADNLIIEYEGMVVPNNRKATIDHVLAVSKGGGMYDLNNIVIACGKCNTKKSDKPVEEFLNRKNNNGRIFRQAE